MILLAPHSLAVAQTAVVSLHAVSPFGLGLGPVQVMRFVEPRIGGIDYSSRFVDGMAEGIPFGEYVASIRAGNAVIGGRVIVMASEVFAALSGSGRSVEYGPGAIPVLKGKLTGLPKEHSGPVWARIFNLYQDVGCCATFRVREDMSFSTPIWEPGEYVIAILDDSGPLYNGVLKLEDLRSEVEVDIARGTLTVHLP